VLVAEHDDAAAERPGLGEAQRQRNEAARPAPPITRSPPPCRFSSLICSGMTSRSMVVFQPADSSVVENTIFGISRQMAANSLTVSVASGCWSAVGQKLAISS
jgi:hypothetical protein